MSEHYPYHEAEHYVEPSNPLEVIDEELRLYPDVKSMREGLIAIGRIYQNTNMLYSLKKYAYLVNVANIMSGNGTEKPGVESDFYAGAILGTHVMVKPAPKLVRQRILSTDVLEDYNPSPWSHSFDPDKEILKEVIEEMARYKDGKWRELFDEQPLEHQERIMDLGDRMYEDITSPEERNRRWDSFTSGYLFAANLIYTGILPE